MQYCFKKFYGVIMNNLFSNRWSPPCERGRFGTYTYAGCQFGTVAMLAVSGYLASTMGWPSIFYFSGAAGLVWSIIWFFYGGSSPSEYKKISPEEREFIETSLKTGEHSKVGEKN
jgi:ACS family sodium-dependent inorganic phosphate cotransporter-like MFS transporter 5